MRSRLNAARTILATTLATSLITTGIVAGTAAASTDPADVAGYGTGAPIDPGGAVLSPRLLDIEGRISVFVQTAGESALAVDQQAKQTQRSAVAGQSAQAQQRADEIVDTADTVETAVLADDPAAQVLYVARYTVPGVAISADADAIRELVDQADVVKITPIVARSTGLPQDVDPANAHSAELVRTLDTWTQTGQTGEGATVAVIDTGIDYTHADFGGPGTVEAYETAVATTEAPAEGWFDPAKYLGGYDFAGTTYNATSTSPDYQPVPVPDANPIDGPGGGHGTHVSGTALGYGVAADSTTFRGSYAELTTGALDGFVVGPGSAPLAGLYGLKVFGDNGGSTDVVGAALDWVGESIANGNQVDVINMSLGSDYGTVDDPDNAKVVALMDHGVLPVIAAGNAGDLTDVAGSPGNAGRALAVAATSSGHGLLDAMAVTAPVELTAGSPYPGQYSANFKGDFTVAGTVAAPTDPENLDGCAPFSEADAALLAGKVAWLEWDDDDVACGSGARFNNAAAAGSVGVILTSELSVFEAGIAGNFAVPGIQLTVVGSQALAPAAHDGTLQVELRSDLKATVEVYDGALEDTPASFTSRGVHGSYGDVVKPDVAAPGVSIVSAGSGTGTGLEVSSGTSMATPMTAGVAALVKQAHPSWTPDDIKAAIINTATHDVSEVDSAQTYAPLRVGTGRIDALQAVTNTVTVRSLDSGGLVTASFGVVEVGAAVTEQRTVQVTNLGDAPAEYSLAYVPRTTMPGVSYTLSTDTVSVAPGESVDVTITLSIPDPAALRKTIDPTMEAVQDGIVRQFVADASGIIELTPVPDGVSRLRVAVYSAPEPVSDMAAAGPVVFPGKKAETARLNLTGRGLAQGEGAEAYISLLAPFQLGIEDPAEAFPEASALQTLKGLDVRYVGASTTAPQLTDPSQGTVSFGIVTEGDAANLSPTGYPVVSIDVDADATPDYATYISKLGDVDVDVAVTTVVETGDVVDIQLVNVQPGGLDANLFDTNVMVLPVSLAAIGFTAASTSTQISYSVHTESYYAPGYRDDPQNVVVDETAAATFDVFAPALWFGVKGAGASESVVFQDTPGTVAVNRSVETRWPHKAGAGRGSPKVEPQILLLHLHNASGDRAEVVATSTSKGWPPKPPKPTPTPSPSPTPKPCKADPPRHPHSSTDLAHKRPCKPAHR